MGIPVAQWLEMSARLRRNKLREAIPLDQPAEREVGHGGLQAQIIAWCNSQWPRWVCDFPRTDLRSTLPVGRHDATVWGPFPQCYLIETKAKGRKRTSEQLVWAARMKAIEWDVKVVYSFEEFLGIVATNG